MASFLWGFASLAVLYLDVYANKVLNMNCDTTGYFSSQRMSSSGNGRLRVRHQDYYRGNQCIKVVKIDIFGQEVECVTVECTVGMTGFNSRYQFGSALLIRPYNQPNVFKGLYNLGNGDCLEKTYTANGDVEKSEGTSTSDSECQTLLRGRNDGMMNGVGSIHLGNFYMGDAGGSFGDTPKRMRQAASAARAARADVDISVGPFGNGVIVNKGVFNGVRRNEVLRFGDPPSYINGAPPPGLDTNGKIILMNRGDASEAERDLIEGLKNLDSGLRGLKSGLQSMKSDLLSGNIHESEDIIRGPTKKHNKFNEEPEKESGDSEDDDYDDEAKLRRSLQDYEVIHTQKVAVLNDNVYGFEKNGPERTITGSCFRFTVQKYIKPNSDDCIKLVTVRKKYGSYVLERLKISCEHIDPKTNTVDSIRFDGAIYENHSTYGVTYVVKDGVCVEKKYWKGRDEKGMILDESACYGLTRRTKSERMSGVVPGNKPITSSDIDVLDKQIVVIFDGSLKGFKEKNTETTFYSNNFEVQVQEYVKDSQCVKVISIKRPDHEDNIDEVKVSCKVTHPIMTNDEDIEFNFGNVIYMLDAAQGVFILKDGECLQRTYHVVTDYTKVVRDGVRKTDNILSAHECFAVTRWRKDERSSDAKLNKDPPIKTLQVPGFMWLLALNGAMSGYKPVGGKIIYSGGVVTIQTQDFHKDPDECKRLAIVSIRGVEADRLHVSCGPIINANVNGVYAKYGNAFIVKPSRGWNTYQVIFNVRKEYCLTKSYTVKWSIIYSNTIEKSKATRMTGKQCQDLMKGSSIGNTGEPLRIGTIQAADHSNIGYKGFFRGLFSGWRW